MGMTIREKERGGVERTKQACTKCAKEGKVFLLLRSTHLENPKCERIINKINDLSIDEAVKTKKNT